MVRYNKLTKRQPNNGFTIIELMVVIVIIGILASITFISYGNYQKSVDVARVQSDLNAVSSAMENARNFGDGYPIGDIGLSPNVLSTFKPSHDSTGHVFVTVSGGSLDGTSYCVNAVSAQDSSIQYYISNTSQGVISGSCP